MLLKNNSLQVLARGSLLCTKKLALALSKNLEENISAFVSKIRKSSDRDRIEYLHIKHFKLHRKTFVKMQEFDVFFKSWYHSNFVLEKDVCIRQSAFQIEELFKGSLFTLLCKLFPSFVSFLTYFSSEAQNFHQTL